MITERARGLGRFRGGGVGAETAPASFQGHINTTPPPPPVTGNLNTNNQPTHPSLLNTNTPPPPPHSYCKHKHQQLTHPPQVTEHYIPPQITV